MRKMLYTAGLTLALVAGSVAAPLSIASAQDIELRLGPDGLKPIIRNRDLDRRDRDTCGEREARAAARDSGLRDPEVVRVTDRRVVVEGMTRRGPERITFANTNGCPEI